MSWQGTRERSEADPANWIPLTALAIEGFGRGTTVEDRTAHLAAQLADRLVFDDLGRRCVARSVARELFTRQAEQAGRLRERRAANRAELRAETNRLRERIRAIRAKQESQDLGLDGLSMSEAALATLTADDIAQRLTESGNRLEEHLSGAMIHHRITEV